MGEGVSYATPTLIFSVFSVSGKPPYCHRLKEYRQFPQFISQQQAGEEIFCPAWYHWKLPRLLKVLSSVKLLKCVVFSNWYDWVKTNKQWLWMLRTWPLGNSSQREWGLWNISWPNYLPLKQFLSAVLPDSQAQGLFLLFSTGLEVARNTFWSFSAVFVDSLE